MNIEFMTMCDLARDYMRLRLENLSSIKAYHAGTASPAQTADRDKVAVVAYAFAAAYQNYYHSAPLQPSEILDMARVHMNYHSLEDACC